MKNINLLKRWIKMLTKNSIYHIEQGVGKNYSKYEIKGYYNDMTGKVSNKTTLDNNGICITKTITGIKTYFPITIFQYALGLYDLYIDTEKEKYINHFITIANWAIENQKNNGMWMCMSEINDTKHLPQSSMCQSEGTSVLLRAYKYTNNKIYKEHAKKAIDFMIKDIKDGGTCLYNDNKVIFQEYVSKENVSVLNGWIFSIFGLYDYILIDDNKKYKDILDRTIKTLSNTLNEYDRKYWTNYDVVDTIASPFYHKLHINQLYVLYDLFKIDNFKTYYDKWTKYNNKKIYKIIAMIIKLKQKILKSKYYDINTTIS